MSVEPFGLLTHSFIGLIFAKRRGIHGTLLIFTIMIRNSRPDVPIRVGSRVVQVQVPRPAIRAVVDIPADNRVEQPEHPEQRAMYPRYSV